jgi:hypothetical protein
MEEGFGARMVKQIGTKWPTAHEIPLKKAQKTNHKRYSNFHAI